MVALVGMLSPVPPPSARDIASVSRAASERLSVLLDELAELITPLASFDTKAEVTKWLDRHAQEYLHLKNTVGRLIMDELTPRDFARFYSHSYEQMNAAVQAASAILGPEDRKALADVIESHREMVAGVMDGLKANPGATLDLLVECTPSLLRVDMCLSAVMLVVAGKMSRWHPSTLKLLAKVAGDHMLQVEDIFLLHDRELAERLATRGPTVSLGEVKRQVGLPS